jgi:hypothetical protein
VTPIENSWITVVALSISNPDAINAQVRNYINVRHSDKGERWGRELETRQYGLNYFTTIEYPGASPKEFLFDDGPYYRTMIECHPSGNAYPSLCTLSSVSERGGGVKSQSNAAVMTDITFRHGRLADWHKIQQQVERFLDGKLFVIGWGR